MSGTVGMGVTANIIAVSVKVVTRIMSPIRRNIGAVLAMGTVLVNVTVEIGRGRRVGRMQFM